MTKIKIKLENGTIKEYITENGTMAEIMEKLKEDKTLKEGHDLAFDTLEVKEI